MSLFVLHPGTFSLLVDHGRPASRSLGVPPGGATDKAAFQIANVLVGNPPQLAALEMALSGPTLRAECDVSACVFGAPFRIDVAGRTIPAGAVFTIRADQVVRIGGANAGARAYLSVRGGFRTPQVLGSATAFEPIAADMKLPCESSNGGGRSLEFADVESLFGLPTSEVFRVLPGPQADWFNPEVLYRQSFTVTSASNRMGIRLAGSALDRPARDMPSEAVAPGAIQITNDGLPIVLGVDGQTIGGYPKVAHVIRADLDRLAQLATGQTVRFEPVGIEEAESIGRRKSALLKRWLSILRIFADP